ncbi:3-oxo-5-alpha-steroid 4-dehydrogenase-domain-containing protein [Lophiotrema nucula]|uniref:very-long-chain enoyl-CoA reductase n=1 Tax=Lophiotrema nucula TaxID=690887 RepID=A0A6A5YKV8_9PLEO|nr:3-oxo-5-alpha-steroid 4-dehydrogenase-domain-containing protein [Lophiotrema nucula]
MGVLDLLPHCISGVYFIYHQDFEKWSFGKLSALTEASLALEGDYQYYYMGFYIHSCAKMRYKGEYRPSYILDPETYDWNPLDGEVRQLLDKKKYVSLARERKRATSKANVEGGIEDDASKQGDETPDDYSDYPLPSAAEGGKAVMKGMSLFELKVPGWMTAEEVEEKVELGDQAIKVKGHPKLLPARISDEQQALVGWDNSDVRDRMCKPIKSLPESIPINRDDSAQEIFQKIADASKFSIHRLRVTKGSDGSPIPKSKELTVHDTGLRNRSAVDVKDLGPQIAWKTVFIIEYLGPLLIHPLFYYGRKLIYGTSAPPSELQKLSFILINLHFLKREWETLRVHRFSADTMPLLNIFKNSGHYWVLSGVNIAYWIYSPNAPTARDSNPLITYLGVALFAIGELGNYSTHLTLKNLRRPGSTDRGIPKGLGFNLVTCPNYMFETIAWIGIWLVNWSLSTGVFLAFSFTTMAIWAKKKERRYRKEFGDKYKRKSFVILPGIY